MVTQANQIFSAAFLTSKGCEIFAARGTPEIVSNIRPLVTLYFAVRARLRRYLGQRPSSKSHQVSNCQQINAALTNPTAAPALPRRLPFVELNACACDPML